ncbi:methylthioadenosine phosphorylase [Parvibaculum lavamentivorans DS-1]|uniref:S-methyl-5'-thioadenosine phosphorylase n=1 Tax=Parvibaculum lavamentivorans (strain DS-1 / DSM 13023 / NCIMB 13966) TaxID=402881 RepID=A7HVC6_PARL1|nr:S-methyl-5'-thioadenosine phosphorylase [Parvibaculum lavamentivorans]ABS63859.1 methylthioadenosine phosphorylase [Parvibaculum lavamentivorans DS-1]
MTKTVLGVIGGSGVYEFPGLRNERWERVETPWGEPSDELHFGELPLGDGKTVQMVFLPRHGRGHPHSPSSINYRANIDAMKRAGVTDIISVSAVGSLKEELPPGHFVIVDQFIDRTFAREKSFFGEGFVAHVSMANPVCPRLGDHIEAACQDNNIAYTRGGTYMVMEGPQFSTLAESNLYRSWGCSVIGMTNMPEAKLAREAEICYATVAMVTDYDCWHPTHAHVEVSDVIRVLEENAGHARAVIRAVATSFGPEREPSPQGLDRVLDTALITSPAKRDPALVKKLDAVAGRVLNQA